MNPATSVGEVPSGLLIPSQALVPASASQTVTPELLYDVQKLLAQFSLELPRHLSEHTSFCFSSASIAAVFAMVLQGLSDTEKSSFLAKANLKAYSPGIVLQALCAIINAVRCSSDTVNVNVANAIALLEPVTRKYLEDFQSTFKGEVFAVSQNATEEVNKWISLQTKGRIDKLLSPGALNNATCALINTLVFDAKWQKIFDKAQPGAFIDVNGNPHSCMLMKKTLPVNYFKGQDCQFIEIPYIAQTGHKHSFVVVLPDQTIPLSKLLDRFTPETLMSMKKRASHIEIQLTMPKLSIQYKLDNLKDLLKQMGLPVDEELSQLAVGAVVDKIISEVTLDVDEDGTRGAAATAAFVTRGGGGPAAVVVNRPFAFFVLDNHTVLFQGNVQDNCFLVTESMHKKGLLQGSKLVSKTYNDTEIAAFFKENADMKMTLSYVPKQTAKPSMTMLTLRGTRFTLVNYTDVQVHMFHDASRNPNAPYFFTLDGQFSQGGFTKDHCQVVFYSDEAGNLCSVSKDEGFMQPRDVVRMKWDVIAGTRSHVDL